MNLNRSCLLAWAFLASHPSADAAAGQEAAPSHAARAPAYPDHANLMVVRDGAGGEQPIETPADWRVRRDHILAHFQEVAGPLPGGERRVPLAMQVISTTREAGLIRKKISFATEPGDRVPAWLLIPEQAQEGPPKPARLCCACIRRSRSARTSRQGSARTASWLTHASSRNEAMSRSLRTIPISANTRSTFTIWAMRARR